MAFDRRCTTLREAGIGAWDWASNEDDAIAPDVVMACAGDVPTMETLAAVMILREAIPELKIRVVNVCRLDDASQKSTIRMGFLTIHLTGSSPPSGLSSSPITVILTSSTG